MQRVFGPGTRLLGRLPLALKFLVVGLTLTAPLGVVVYAYVASESAHVSFSAKERVGVRAMTPLLRLTTDVALMRCQAVDSGRPAPIPPRDIQAAARAQQRYGRALRTAAEWRGVQALLSAAGKLSGEPARTGYDRAADALLRLIVRVGDGSNLTLDPDLDSYYVMDAIQFRTPPLIDETGRISLRWAEAARRDHHPTPALRADTGVALGAIQSLDAALNNSIGTAAAHTANTAVRDRLPALLRAADDQIKAFEKRLRTLQASGLVLPLRSEGAATITAVDRLTSESARQLDKLLAARIAGSEGRERRVELLAAVAALAAIYLFIGFYLCIVGPVRRMVETLRAVASGDHSKHVDVPNRDELGFVARVLNEMVDKVRQATERLAHDATHDILTGLPNRALVIKQLTQMLPHAAEGNALSVLFIDLDGFKPINDSIGHSAGDEVLRTVASRLDEITRAEDVLARLAGDEFLVVSAGLENLDSAQALADRMLDAIAPEIPVRDAAGDLHDVVVGASIGIVFVTDPAIAAEQVIRNADVAMYRAKQRGRGRIEVFGEPLRRAVEERQQVREELRRAIKQGELEVHYQPIVELAGATTIGFEALVRWRHPERGLLGPAAFIPIAEETWLINALGEQVLRAACAQLAVWCSEPTYMSVNISARQLTDPELVAIVDDALLTASVEPSALCLEITETALLADPAAAAEALNALHSMGVRLALDDFGTGYSSLQHLKDFPLDLIKLDRSFVSGLADEQERGDDAIVSGVLGLAQALGLSVIAEGIETPEQHARLVQLGCEAGQGYLFGRPALPGAVRSDERDRRAA
jgi:diguanylate cyclase (GGDEF)-like protein